MKTALVIATAARRLATRSLATTAAAAASARFATTTTTTTTSTMPVMTATMMTTATTRLTALAAAGQTRAFASKKSIGKPSGDGSSSSDSEEEDDDSSDSEEDDSSDSEEDDSSDSDFDGEDDDDEDDDDDEEEEEEIEDPATYRAAKRAAFTDEDLARFEDPEDDWDEERWGALDSEDWQGFDGDLDAVTEEGVPKWLQSVRDLSAIHQEKRMRAKLARRALEEAKKNVVRVRKVDALGRAYGTGRRKTSTARVWIKKTATPFTGTVKINKKDLTEYLVRDTHREEVLKPFVVVGEVGNFDVYATVSGGGLTGQAGALRHGIARALQHFDPALRPALKKEKLLTRDPRGVERKKAGQKKARKKFQWVKR